MKKANIITSAIFIIMGLVIIYATTNFKQTFLTDNFVGADFFPRLMAAIMIFLAILLLITTYQDKSIQNTKLSDVFNLSMKIPLIGIVILGIYLMLMKPLGFIIDTILLNLIFLLVFRVRNIKYLILVPLLTTLIIYYVFGRFLMVPLPEGLFSF